MDERLRQTRELIADIKGSGDADAQEALYTRYWERIYRSVRARMHPRLRRRVSVEDVVQETLLHAIRDFEKFDHESEGAFMRWLNSLALNRIRDISKSMKSQKNDVGRERSLDDDTCSTSSISESIEDRTRRTSRVVLHNEDLHIYEAALDSLSEEDREIIIMKDWETFTFQEIADRKKFASADTARRIYHDAKALHTAHMGHRGET